MYLSRILIHNYKGIQELDVKFTSTVNIIIGENGSYKSALIDAIRLLYNLGEPIRELAVTKEDFYEEVLLAHQNDKVIGHSSTQSETITIAYEFRGLTLDQKGAFYEYMVSDFKNPDNDYARIEIQYNQDKKYPKFSYTTGGIAGQKADPNTFSLFQHYYLSALRDSTKDLLNVRGNILGKVIKRIVERNQTEDEIKTIISDANKKLLERDEVISTKKRINDNLENIYKKANQSQIGLQIEQSRIDYIVNVIKPYLPHDWMNNSNEGFYLWQNSLGFNNLIYIATVLGVITGLFDSVLNSSLNTLVSYYLPPVGVENQKLNKDQFVLYPNPVTDILSIRSEEEFENLDIIITDYLGREINNNTHHFAEQKIEIDVAGYTKGIYVLKIFNNDKLLETKKLVVN